MTTSVPLFQTARTSVDHSKWPTGALLIPAALLLLSAALLAWPPSRAGGQRLGRVPGPWRTERPLLDLEKHPWENDPDALCAWIPARKDNFTCPHTDPECFTHYLHGLLEFLGWFFTKNGFKWAIAWGTQLGAHRNQTILPWDKDLDFFVETRLWEQIMQRNHTLLGEAWRYGFLFYVSPLNSTGFTPYNKALACFHWDSPLLAAIPGGHAMAPGTRMPFADLFEMVPVGGDLYRLGEGHDPRTSGHILANVTFQTLYEIDGLSLPGMDEEGLQAVLDKWYPNWQTPNRWAWAV